MLSGKIMNLVTNLLSKLKPNRKPDFIIGGEENPYMLRWYIIPRNRLLNVYMHKVLRSDEPLYHDHPWWSLGIILEGAYYEHTPSIDGDTKTAFERCKVKFRNGQYLHWLEVKDGPVWTLFMTGPKFKEWGFICPRGWVHWKEATRKADANGNEGIQCPD